MTEMFSKLKESSYGLSIILLFYCSPCFSFATTSHEIINDRAARGSQTFNAYLADVLGFVGGLNTELKNTRGVNRPIVGWIREGGAAEDRLFFRGGFGEFLGGFTRSLNHFHQPLRNSWDQAGFIRANPSSARWAQNPHQAPGRMASWFDARRTYLDALKAATEQERNALFAETFQTLGQVMHLVADLASISHTRDDAHPLAYEFEKFVAKRSEVITGFTGFDPSILQQPTGDSFATLPIARLWDTNTYNGTNPPGDLDRQIGLAEFANANFFSLDTVKLTAGADPELPLPAVDRLDLGPTAPDPRTGKPARYLSKNVDGVPVAHMVRVSLFSNYAPIIKFILDDRVYQDYAQYLLPRAIGYSAGILDYFFRGKIKIEAPDRYVYSLAKYEAGNAGFFTKVRFKVSNATEYPNTTEDTVGAGEMRAVVRYRKPLSGDLIDNPFANLSEPFYAVSDPKSASLSRITPEEHTFDFSGSNRIPTNAADIFLMVVWQGRLGMEDGAVMVGGKNLREPDPFDRGNVSDYDCYQDQIYTVTQPSIQSADRDVNDDNVIDLFGPATETNEYVMIFPAPGPVPTQNDILQKYHFRLSTTTYAKYGRFMMLQDGDTFGVASLAERVEDDFTHSVTNYDRSTYYFAAVRNEIAGGGVRIVSPSFLYRVVPLFHAVVRLASLSVLNSPTCQSQLSVAGPPLARVPDTVVEVRE